MDEAALVPEGGNVLAVQFETCATCRFYFKEQTLCRRNPPQVFIVGSGLNGVQTQSLFPPAHDNMWCGEHRRRDHDL